MTVATRGWIAGGTLGLLVVGAGVSVVLANERPDVSLEGVTLGSDDGSGLTIAVPKGDDELADGDAFAALGRRNPGFLRPLLGIAAPSANSPEAPVAEPAAPPAVVQPVETSEPVVVTTPQNPVVQVPPAPIVEHSADSGFSGYSADSAD